VGVPETRHDRTRGGKGTRGYNVVTMTQQDVSQAHLYILNNTHEVVPYIRTHKEYLTSMHPKMNMMKLLQEHNRTFINWFKEIIFSDDNASKSSVEGV